MGACFCPLFYCHFPNGVGERVTKTCGIPRFQRPLRILNLKGEEKAQFWRSLEADSTRVFAYPFTHSFENAADKTAIISCFSAKFILFLLTYFFNRLYTGSEYVAELRTFPGKMTGFFRWEGENRPFYIIS
jgi:hypothetical protein